MNDRRGFFKSVAGIIAGVCGFRLVQDPPVKINENPLMYSTMIQDIKITADLGRTPVWELGRIAPYHRYVNFPVNIKTDVEENFPLWH